MRSVENAECVEMRSMWKMSAKGFKCLLFNDLLTVILLKIAQFLSYQLRDCNTVANATELINDYL